MNTCKSCSAPIIWAKTAKGKAMPLDAEPSAKGNIALADGVAVYLTKDALAQAAGWGTPLFLSHFVSCPQAARHRRPK